LKGDLRMGNTASADKNARKAERRKSVRVQVKSELKALRKKALEMIASKKSEQEVQAELNAAISKFDRAAGNTYIHHRTASRKIGRMMRAAHKAKIAGAAVGTAAK